MTVLREGYSARDFARDALAGVVVGIVAFPLAIAFAIASGVRPEQGLYTAIIAGFIISVFGRQPGPDRGSHRGLCGPDRGDRR
ncbi:MAG: SulP family inorganic anion transporter [Verrucomicrobia bacterium]|nr:SulP family inorganic anion transporter [Verrucomicrobiota bacterium]